MNNSTKDRDVELRALVSRTSGAVTGSSIPNRVALATNRNRLPQSEELFALSVKMSATRDTRNALFPATLFGEPGWDMLLALYRAVVSGHRLTVSNMVRASQVPDTTALRWIEKLVELGLVTRRHNHLDARVIFIEMEPATFELMEGHLLETWNRFYSSD